MADDTVTCVVCKGSGRVPTTGHSITYLTIHSPSQDVKYRIVDGVMDPTPVSVTYTGNSTVEEVQRKSGYLPDGRPSGPNSPAIVNMPDPLAGGSGLPPVVDSGGGPSFSQKSGLEHPGSFVDTIANPTTTEG